MTLNKTDRIVITLGKQIVHGKYVPGSPLPAEAELCEEFATSRNIIREVFRSLQRAVFERTWMGDEANMPQTLQEHKALFDAIRHQDGDAAEQAALTMIASSTRRLKEIT